MTTDWAEEKLLKGALWAVGNTSGNITAGSTITYGMTTGNDPVMYMSRHYQSSAFQVLVELYEEGFTGGSLVPSGNRNMNNTTGTSPSSHFTGVTRSGGGTLRASLLMIGLSTGGASNANANDDEYFVLKPNTNYVLAFTNQTGSGGFINFRFTYRQAST